MNPQKITIPGLLEKKQRGEKITMLTAYDVPMARLLDEAGVDLVLVGDSLGMVALGYSSTVPVTMEEMLHHSKAVRRGVKHALVIGDMPFMSFNMSPKETLRNAGRFLKEAGCDAVKVEGGQGSEESLEAVGTIVAAGIPVLGHLGLTPQTAGKVGGFKVQGRSAAAARRLLEAALQLEAAGCFGLVLECVPSEVSERVTDALKIPTIGIGAGPHCDGQVLVTQDLLSLSGPSRPRFVRPFGQIDQQIRKAITQFQGAVEAGSFPSAEESYRMPEAEAEKFKEPKRAKRREKVIRIRKAS